MLNCNKMNAPLHTVLWLEEFSSRWDQTLSRSMKSSARSSNYKSSTQKELSISDLTTEQTSVSKTSKVCKEVSELALQLSSTQEEALNSINALEAESQNLSSQITDLENNHSMSDVIKRYREEAEELKNKLEKLKENNQNYITNWEEISQNNYKTKKALLTKYRKHLEREIQQLQIDFEKNQGAEKKCSMSDRCLKNLYRKQNDIENLITNQSKRMEQYKKQIDQLSNKLISLDDENKCLRKKISKEKKKTKNLETYLHRYTPKKVTRPQSPQKKPKGYAIQLLKELQLHLKKHKDTHHLELTDKLLLELKKLYQYREKQLKKRKNLSCNISRIRGHTPRKRAFTPSKLHMFSFCPK